MDKLEQRVAKIPPVETNTLKTELTPITIDFLV